MHHNKPNITYLLSYLRIYVSVTYDTIGSDNGLTSNSWNIVNP